MSSAAAMRVVAEGLQAGAGGDAARLRRRAVGDWSRPIAVANEHLVGPALFASLHAAGAIDDLPEDVRDYLELLHRCNVARNVALRRQLDQLLENLARGGIEAMLLKGARSFAVALYPDPGIRMFRDLDIVVQRDDVARAQAVLAALGYGVATTYESGHNAVAEYTRPGDPGAVDLHVEIVDVPHLLGAAEMWERSIPVTVGAVACRTPSPTDAVLHHLVHAQIHFRGAFYWGAVELRQLYEFAALVRHGDTDIDWPFILARLETHGLRAALESYALSALRLLGAPWPLPVRPSLPARLHELRCAAQMAWPALAGCVAPWANLRAAFATHRMGARYPELGGAARRRLRHTAQFLRKTTPAALVSRMFRERT